MDLDASRSTLMPNHPTNNINTIVLQTSPAKFFQEN